MRFKNTQHSAPIKKVSKLRRHDFSYQYNARTINYSVWSTGQNAQTIVFLGTVQVGKLPAWIARRCPSGTVVVQGAPHWLARDDGSDIPEFMYRFTREAFTGILKTFPTNKLDIITDSQATPGVLRLLTTDSSKAAKVSNLVLLQPLGLNATAYAGAADERIAVFKKRITMNFKYQLVSLVSDWRLLYNHGQLLRIVGYIMRNLTPSTAAGFPMMQQLA